MEHPNGKYGCFIAMLLMLSSRLSSCVSNPDQNMGSSPNTGPSPKTPQIAQPPSIAFGKAAWEEYFGDVGEEPARPDNINEVLDSDCPFWLDKKVKDTHLLLLIPATVDSKPLTLDLLGETSKESPTGEQHKVSTGLWF